MIKKNIIKTVQTTPLRLYPKGFVFSVTENGEQTIIDEAQEIAELEQQSVEVEAEIATEEVVEEAPIVVHQAEVVEKEEQKQPFLTDKKILYIGVGLGLAVLFNLLNE